MRNSKKYRKSQSYPSLRLRLGRSRRRERVRQRPHGLHLHLQRRHVVGGLLQNTRRRQLPAPGNQPPEHLQPVRPHSRSRRSCRPRPPAADLARDAEELTAGAAAAEEDGPAPSGLSAGGEREGGVRSGLDGERPAAGGGAERVQEAASVGALLARGAPLGRRLCFSCGRLHFIKRRRRRRRRSYHVAGREEGRERRKKRTTEADG